MNSYMSLMNRPAQLQSALLGRFLLHHVRLCAARGPGAWQLTGSVRRASPVIQSSLQDDSALSAERMCLWQCSIQTRDVLLWPAEGLGGVVVQCLQTGDQLAWELQLLERVSSETWGSVWRQKGTSAIKMLEPPDQPELPSFWRMDGPTVTCSH